MIWLSAAHTRYAYVWCEQHLCLEFLSNALRQTSWVGNDCGNSKHLSHYVWAILFNASVTCAGAVPSDLGKLSALKKLYLGANKLSGAPMRRFGVLKKSSLLACSYVVGKIRSLNIGYNERQLVYGSGVVIGPAPCVFWRHVRMLIEKSQFPTKPSRSPRARCFHAYPGGEHEWYRAWFKTTAVV